MSSGFAELPLHDGHVPLFLLERMKKLGGLIARYIVEYYGPRELLTRLSDPLWFQAFNNVIGMDWDSSGSTTIVLYVLKNMFPPSMFRDNEIAVLGGKGRDSRNVVEEARSVGDVVDYNTVIDTSRMAAKIDGVALQDGYTLYIHGLVIDSRGGILVIQQGLNEELGIARRYHIFTSNHPLTTNRDPHSGVASVRMEPSLNLVDADSLNARRAIVEIVASTPVNSLLQNIGEVNRLLRGEHSILSWSNSGSISRKTGARNLIKECPRYYRPVSNIRLMEKIAEEIKERGLREFDELLRVQGIGAESIRALALVADLIYGYKPSLRDPTTSIMDPFIYAYAHGGKDGVPYPIKVEHIDKTIDFFTNLLRDLKTGNKEKEYMLRKLALFASKIKLQYLEASGD